MEIDIKTAKKVNLNSQAITTVYRHYKDNFLPIGIIIACIGILFFVIAPQFKNYLSSKEELKTQTQKLKFLKNNYNFLLSLDDSKTDTDFKMLSKVLPPNKDFVGIMSAITIVASKTFVTVEDFDFTLGDLNKVDDNSSKYPLIKINVNIGGSAKDIAKFIAELYKTVPASQVTSIKTAGNVSSLVINFYYKPFPPQNVNSESFVVPISAKNQSLIESVSLWNSSGLDAFPDVSASVSGGTNPSPF
ncbi:MAG: hypothetical protein AAB702_02350 [Patescibacteria group bacterium]